MTIAPRRSGDAVDATTILHVVENLARGGLERMVVDLACRQQALGYRVEVACVFELGALADELAARGVGLRALGKRRGFDARVFLRMRRWLAESTQPGRRVVVHTHNACAHYHAVFAMAGMSLHRVVNTRHGMGSPDPDSRGERLYRLALPRTDVVATVCDAARRRFAAQGIATRPGMLQVVPNGIHLDRLSTANEDARHALAATLGLGAGTRMLGTVGRLNAVKDQATLLHAFARLQAVVPDVALVVVGDGPLHGALESLAAELGVAERVRLLGDRDDVPAMLAGLEIFMLSSLSEGYSLALLEACGAGLPVIATSVGGNAEIVDAGSNGLLVAASDPVAMAEAMRRLLGDAALAARMGAASLAWAREHAGIDAMVSQYDTLYSRTTAASGHGLLSR